MASSTYRGGHSQNLRFTQFVQLPTELQAQIWQVAVHQVTVNRFIRVGIHHQVRATMHSCVVIEDRFCGNHGQCKNYRTGQPCDAAYCMADGYFATTNMFPDPEDPTCRVVLLNLSLTCQQSRRAVLLNYPKMLKVYQGQWHSGIESRVIRYSPVTDILLVTSVADRSSLHLSPGVQDDYTRREEESIMQTFPQNPAQFQSFREALSSFHQIGIHYHGSRGLDAIETDNESNARSDDISIKVEELMNKLGSSALLLYLESLKNLWIWPEPAYWPEVWQSPVRVADVKSIQSAWGSDLRELQDYTVDLIHDYQRLAAVQRKLMGQSTEHWISRPPLIERIGCFAAPSWLEVGN